MMNQWTIGDVKVTRVPESEAPWDATWLISNATRENVKREAEWLFPLFSTEAGKLNMSIQSFIIESQGKRIVVDTCIGNEKTRANAAWNDLHLPFLENLERVGVKPGSVDYVVCTHLHVDHVGWNTTLHEGEWVATFPSARYLFERTEWDYWSRTDKDDSRETVEDSVRPIVNAGLAELIDPDRRITSEVWLEPTPGHTPGHMSVRISSRGHDAVITGDLIHHPIQCAYPEWNSNFDYDAAAAHKTRRDFLERHADRDVLVFGTHFASPACGRIVSHNGSFRFVAAG